MNKVFLIGNLTKDPELTKTQQNGTALCKFTLAITRNYSKDGKHETDFLPITVWRAQAENCAKFLKKGSKAAISGSIQTRTYDANGERHYVTEIVADEVQFLTTKNEDGEDVIADDADFSDSLDPVTDEDIPF